MSSIAIGTVKVHTLLIYVKVKQSLCMPIKGPEGSRNLRLPDIETIET